MLSERRKALGLSLTELAGRTGINRSTLSKLERGDHNPSVDQLLRLSEELEFSLDEVILDEYEAVAPVPRKQVAIAGTGYVGLSLAVLLSQHHDVTAVDIVEAKVEKLKRWESPIQDTYIEKYLTEHKERALSLSATTDGASAYAKADYIIVAVPTNYDPKTNFFDCSAVESVLKLIRDVMSEQEKKPVIVIKSTVPVGYTASVREKLGMDNILFSPEFLRESKALYLCCSLSMKQYHGHPCLWIWCCSRQPMYMRIIWRRPSTMYRKGFTTGQGWKKRFFLIS